MLTEIQSSIVAEVSAVDNYKYIPAGLAKKYNVTPYMLKKQLDELVKLGIINKENKLSYDGGKYRTIVKLSVNIK